MFRPLKNRLATRPDTEHMMSLNRAVFSCALIVYMAFARPPHWQYGLLVSAVGMVVTIAIFAHILLWPAANPVRRHLALGADLGVLCYDMHLGGASTGLFYPLLLWTVLGNGLRFGIASLVTATVLGVLGFTMVVASTPFWLDHPSLALGLVLGLVLIPIYAGTLLKSLSRAKLAAEAANEAKTAFLASLSHELRTPLHAVIGSGSLLRQTGQTQEQAELTGTIMQASKSLLGLIDDLLNYSRIEAGGLQAEEVAFTVPGVLLNARDILLPSAEAKGLRFAVHVDHCIPSAVRGDQRHIQEILLNLLSNAIKFTSFGGVLVSASAVPAEEDEVRLRFEITDTGIGISPEAHGRIFERFTQADSSIGARFGGTGLGLAICKRLVERLGGQIGLNSQPGTGSTFWFELPVARIADVEEAPIAWPERVVGLGIGEPHLAVAAAAGAALHLGEFEGIDLAALVRASAEPNGPLLIAAPASPAQAQALISAARDAARNAVPALIVVSTPAAGIAEMAWIAPTLLPAGFDAAALARAAHTVLALARATERVASEDMPVRADTPPMRILVADDNKLNQRVVGAILASGGHRHDVVADGQAALDALEANEYDLVLMDVNMPGIDGIEATKLYRVMEMGQPHLPIVGLTADATPEAAERCRRAGMDEILVKPVTARELLEVIALCAAPTPRAAVPDESVRLRPVEDIVLDQERLRDLALLGGDSFVIELLHGFAGEAEGLFENIVSAVHDNNWPAVQACAHAVASSAANLGAVRVHHLAAAMERLGPGEIRASGRAKVTEMRRELDRLRQAATEFEARGRGDAPGEARTTGGLPAVARPPGYSAAS
jgi:two-component system, sensor histidine kinase RpfC